MTQQELRKMIEEYLDNGLFYGDYAQTEFAGLTAMLAEEWGQDRIHNIGLLGHADFDSLSSYAYEKARAEDLTPGRDYR